MKRLSFLCLPLLLAAACGDDGGGGPDARTNQADAMNPDGAVDPDGGDSDANTTDATPPDGMVALMGIGDARGAADGATSVSIENALVTYTKPAIGNDLAGFFIQDAQTGPALFVAIDPSTLTPVPAIGDDVSFTITEMGTAGTLRQATMISDWAVNNSGNDISGLVQDVSGAADLVSALGDYEAELISGTFTVTGTFGFAGSGHVAATIDSTAITANEDLLLRVPETLQDTYGFEVDCVITVDAVPMWRFNSDAQVSVWEAGDFTATCPDPTVVSAAGPTATTVDVVFSRAIDATSIIDAASQFTFTGGAGLTASAATVDGNTVTVTTGPQTPGQEYTVTVADTVTDVLGGGIGTPASATFNGFGTPEAVCNDSLDDDIDGFVDCLDTDCVADAACTWASQLYLWEVDADTPGTDAAEFIEIRNMAAVSTDLSGYYLVLINGSDDVTYSTIALSGSLAAGAVVAPGNPLASNSVQNGADGVLLVQCATCTGAADIPNGTDVGTAATFMVGANTITKIDALAHGTGDADDAELMAKLGVAAQFDEDANGNKDNESLQRTSLAGWTALAPTAGATGAQL